MTRLTPAEIANRIESLRPLLTAMQAARLTVLGDLVGSDGRFLLRQALEAGEFPLGDERAQDAFREFRARVNSLARDAGVDLTLELDSRKTTPDTRYGWFIGNPVERSLVAFTEDAAENIGIASPVAPEVAELGESRRLRVYVSFHPTSGKLARSATALVDQLTDALSALDGYDWDVTNSHSVGIGADVNQTRAQLCAEADVCVSLISPAYLGTPERHLAFARRDHLVAVAFSGLPHGPVDLKPLQRHEVVLQDSPWDELRGPQRKKYVNELIREIQRVISPPGPNLECNDEETRLFKVLLAKQLRAHRGDDSPYLVDSELREASLQESLLNRNEQRTGGTPLRAIDRLVAWAIDEKLAAPRLCALLGDVGMGKTTTAKLFTSRLLELHEADSSSPLPILFDLRDVRVSELTGTMALDHILDNMLDATRPQGVSPKRLNADVVRKQLETGRTVIVFDGLDEVLVHLSPHDRQLFTRQLWRALPADSAAKMLLTCRTQYFRTIRDEADFFNGQTRQGLRGSDYLALLMLPFRKHQIREYLAGNLGRDQVWVDRFLDTIGAVHNLTELAQRPITLRLISDQVEFIETAKLEGRNLRSVDIYAEVVDRWISRDEGKHTLTPDHKRLLMEEIAAGLWRSGKNSWSPAEVDDWLLALLDARPDIRRHYRKHVPDLWTADFRTATFLKREGDTFEFAHRSLFEYFLARYLCRNLNGNGQLDQSLDVFAMRVPSTETLDFLGQSIAEEPDQALRVLESIGRKYRTKASELAFAYAIHADRHGYPRQSLVGIDLAGADLRGWTIGKHDMLAMSEANLAGANLHRTHFTKVDLTDADLTNANAVKAEFHESTLARSSWGGASLRGTIMRLCDITRVDLSQSDSYRTQLLHCSPPPTAGPGLFIAPNVEFSRERPPREASLSFFTGYMGAVNAIAWSPDNTRVLTGDSTGATRVWDAITGDQLYQLSDNTGSVNAAAWSPDNTRILTGTHNGARVWDTTGKLVHRLADDSDWVRAVAWSPDNTRFLTRNCIWNATTGEQVLALKVSGDWVHSAAWSPNNTHIVIGTNDGAHVWNAATGKLVRQLDTTGAINAVAWAPDNTQILTAGDESFAQIWNAASGKLVRQLDTTGAINAVAWAPDNTQILTAGIQGVAQVWNAATGKLVHEASKSGSINDVAWSKDKTRILVGDTNGARIRDSNTGKIIHNLTTNGNWVREVALSSDNTRILTGDINGARIWDADTGKLIHHLGKGSTWMRTVAWSPDNAHILTGGDGGIQVWNAKTGALVHQVTDRPNGVNAAAWSTDNKRTATADHQGVIRVWDAINGKLIHQLIDNADGVNAVAWSPDNTRILTGDINGTVRVWNATTGDKLLELQDLGTWTQSVTWSPDSAYVLIGDTSGARVWNAHTGKLIRRLSNRVGMVSAADWSPDNSRILTGDTTGTARIWNARTGKLIHQLNAHVGEVNAVAWSPDNTYILTGDDGGVVRVWDASTGSLVSPSIALLSDSEYAVFDAPRAKLIGCTKGAWRWIGWTIAKDHGADRLPAETFGRLPELAD